MQKKVKLALLCMQRYPWEQGVAMQAFLEQNDMPAVIALAKEAAYRALPDGRIGIIGAPDTVTDPCAGGEALLACARLTGDADLIRAAGSLLSWALYGAPRSEKGIVYHMMTGREFWVDSMYMLPPFLAAAGHPKEAFHQMDGYWRALYDMQCGLMHHIWNEERQTYTRAAHWGVGNGWALAAMARMISLMPDAMENERLILKERAASLIDALLNHMRTDGLFHDVVDDPATFVEANLSQMLCYTLLRGMTENWLPAKYLAPARLLRRTVREKVDAYGLVRGVCGAPSFDKPGVAPEGQAFFLMMEGAWKRFRQANAL